MKRLLFRRPALIRPCADAVAVIQFFQHVPLSGTECRSCRKRRNDNKGIVLFIDKKAGGGPVSKILFKLGIDRQAVTGSDIQQQPAAQEAEPARVEIPPEDRSPALAKAMAVFGDNIVAVEEENS